MSRKAISRDLPLLEELFPGFAGFPASANKKSALIEKLRMMAEGRRASHPQPFYPMRDVAKHFGLPLATVGLAYEALEHEGILVRIRGSQTLVSGKTVFPCKPVRAVIGFPIRMHSVVVSPYSRALLIALEDRLQDNGFIADFIFFRDNQDRHPDFAKRLIRRNVNIIIWHTPDPSTSEVMRSLSEHGIQQLVIQTTECATSFDQPTYLLDWQTAYNEAGEDWHRQGIRHILVPCPAHLHSKRVLKLFTAIMAEHGMRVEMVASDASTLFSTAKTLSHSAPTVVAFLDLVGSERLFSEQPLMMEQILQFARIAFCRGLIRAPYFECRRLSADLVGFSADHVAEKIVSDLRRAPDFSKSLLNTFYATYTSGGAFNVRGESI